MIIATQMLEYVENPKPKLSEVADVANAVLEGTDCVMLSGEVANGKYPVKCVQQMSDIINKIESWSKKTTRYLEDSEKFGKT